MISAGTSCRLSGRMIRFPKALAWGQYLRGHGFVNDEQPRGVEPVSFFENSSFNGLIRRVSKNPGVAKREYA